MNFSEKLKQLRILNNYTQYDIAEICNVTRSAVSNWENGRRFPESTVLQILSKIYNVSIDDLLGDDELKYNSLELRKDPVLVRSRKMSYGVPIINALYTMLVLALLTIFLVPVIKDKISNDNNDIVNFDANLIEEVSFKLIYKYDFQEYIMIPEEYSLADNGKKYVLDNFSCEEYLDDDRWSIEKHLKSDIKVSFDENNHLSLQDHHSQFIITNKDYFKFTNNNLLYISTTGYYRIELYTINKMFYVEAFQL